MKDFDKGVDFIAVLNYHADRDLAEVAAEFDKAIAEEEEMIREGTFDECVEQGDSPGFKGGRIQKQGIFYSIFRFLLLTL